MGLLLDFSVTPRRRETTLAAVPAAGADIVIFPGVRLEQSALDLGARIRTASDSRDTRRPDA